MSESNYYKKNLPVLIEKLKTALTQILDVIDKPIEEKITDDKLFNVLKAKRQASEDARFFMKEIEILENDLNGVETPIEVTETTNITKKYSKK